MAFQKARDCEIVKQKQLVCNDEIIENVSWRRFCNWRTSLGCLVVESQAATIKELERFSLTNESNKSRSFCLRWCGATSAVSSSAQALLILIWIHPKKASPGTEINPVPEHLMTCNLKFIATIYILDSSTLRICAAETGNAHFSTAASSAHPMESFNLESLAIFTHSVNEAGKSSWTNVCAMIEIQTYLKNNQNKLIKLHSLFQRDEKV